MSRRRLLGIAIAAVALLAGCAPLPPAEEPTATPSPTPSATARATPTPSPTVPAPPTKPAVDDLIVSPAGLGPLLVGAAPPVTDPALDILVFDPAGCPPDQGPVPGIWVTNYPDQTYFNGRSGPPFRAAVNDAGVVSRIDVWAEDIATDRGVTIGSAVADVSAAYPDASEIVDFERALVYVIRGSTGTLFIEIDTMTDGGADDAFVGHVTSIRVGGPAVPAYAISNTGNLINPCTYA